MLSTSRLVLAVTATLAATANAHMAVFHQAMWCLNGNTGQENYNSYDIVNPLYQLPFNKWWCKSCNEFPPAPGVFLDLPAGGSFMAEIAENRAKTSQSYNSRDASDWPDGGLHAQNESMAAGTAFAISYNSDISQVRPDNLVVFSVRHRTPWKRVVWYDVPAAMPACPPEGCICAVRFALPSQNILVLTITLQWGWVPNGCGQPNMYHQAFRCRVTGATSTTPVAAPQPPVWCEGNPDACTKGAKQMVYWNQAEGNNIYVDGFDNSGGHKSPGYNGKCGFWDGSLNVSFRCSKRYLCRLPHRAAVDRAPHSPTTIMERRPTMFLPLLPAPAPSPDPAAASPSNTGSTSPQAQNDTRPNSPAPQSETHSSAPRPRCPAGHRRRKSTGETVEKRLLKTHHARKPVTW
ncbi:hypothetical protein BKA70DRAFT_1249801 [Coprinopsis sp. MPI-PUGE-AT-0042]|nr:hypothetical protein BKA70DRAFT_1249801 [Coprinopsis sp. MPI-PUGE-AT-0042]